MGPRGADLSRALATALAVAKLGLASFPKSISQSYPCPSSLLSSYLSSSPPELSIYLSIYPTNLSIYLSPLGKFPPLKRW